MKSLLLLLVLSSLPALAATNPGIVEGGNGITLPPPPATEIKPVTDTLHGVTLTDNYRWLEDAKAPETRAWIDTQMKYTESYLSQVKIRPEIATELSKLLKVQEFSVPTERGGKYFFTKRLPQENQASIYLRNGLHGQDEILIDANKLSADQNTSVTIDDIAQDGSLLVYGVRAGGADEESVHLLDIATRKDLADSLPSARYFGVALAPDKQGIYYARVNDEGSIVYYHKLGTAASADELIFGKSFEGEKFGAMDLIGVGITDNLRYLIIFNDQGVPAKRIDIYAKDLRQPNSPIRKVIHGIDNRFTPVNIDDDFYVLTDYLAPNYRVIKIHFGETDPKNWPTIVPEGKDVISGISIAGGKIFTTSLHDVVTQTRIFSLDGKQVGEIKYPTLGSASDVAGRADSDHAFYTFQSFIMPETIYHYDVKSGKAEVFAKPNVPFKSEDYELKQVFYTSKDGTRVPMLIGGKKGATHNGHTPTLLYAYGGFLVNLTPVWSPRMAWWMEQGGFIAQPNLRGGGEYGEKWHQAGMFEKKQNVFDDFYAAAQYLVDQKYTDVKHLAIRGGSNGGLLMGAAMTQHPEMFGAISCGYPLLDMIRFQKFLVGKWWTSEYGSADNADQFPYLLKYSPYQNVKPGTKFPAIMFTSGDSDTRVDPLHARKMAALVQHDNGGDRPILLHYQTISGHSAGVSINQEVTDISDDLSFLWNEVGSK